MRKGGSSLPLTFGELSPYLQKVILQRSVFIFPCFYPLNNTAYRAVITDLKMSGDTSKCISAVMANQVNCYISRQIFCSS
jgi:hypothetical protein